MLKKEKKRKTSASSHIGRNVRCQNSRSWEEDTSWRRGRKYNEELKLFSKTLSVDRCDGFTVHCREGFVSSEYRFLIERQFSLFLVSCWETNGYSNLNHPFMIAFLVNTVIHRPRFVFPANLHIIDVCETLSYMYRVLYFSSLWWTRPPRQLLPFFSSLHLPFFQLWKLHCFNFMQEVVWCFG